MFTFKVHWANNFISFAPVLTNTLASVKNYPKECKNMPNIWNHIWSVFSIDFFLDYGGTSKFS